MNLLLFERAMVVAKDCAGVVSGQNVLVVQDGTLGAEITESFVYSAKALGANVMTFTYQPRHFVSMREIGLFAGASLALHEFGLPKPLLSAMRDADVVIILNSDMEMLFDQDFLALLEGERRMMWMPYLNEDSLLRLLPESSVEAADLNRVTTAVGNLFAGARDVVIHSDAGTDLRMQIGDYRINWGTGVFEAGKGYGGLQILPGGQISTIPNAESADGVVIIDRSVSAPEFKELLDPIRLTVRRGYVTQIEGGVEAERVARFLASLNYGHEAYHFAEIGVGTNKRCQAAGIAGPAEDTHIYGCVSLALGTDLHLGGETRGPCHLDATIRAATLLLDGRTVVEQGNLVM